MQSHIDCICLTFLHCASQMFTERALISTGKVTRAAFIWLFSSVSFQMCLQMAGLQPEGIQSHTGCICLVFLHCAFPNVYWKSLGQRRHGHTGCIFCVRYQMVLKMPVCGEVKSHKAARQLLLLLQGKGNHLQNGVLLHLLHLVALHYHVTPVWRSTWSGSALCVFKCLFKVFE